jgi:hypothetical protein
MNFKRSLPGYIATGALVLTTTLWTYWGVAEMYYEGWGLPFPEPMRYLIPGAACLTLTLVALTWPRMGGWSLIVIGGAFTTWWVRLAAGRGWLSLKWILGTLFPLGGLLIVVGVLLLLEGRYRRWLRAQGWTPSRNWLRRNLRYILAVGFPLITTLVISVNSVPTIVARIDDGNRGARLIEGHGVTLIWAPEGPGWNWRQSFGGYPSWDHIALYGVPPTGLGEKPGYKNRQATAEDMEMTGLCRYLSEDGLTLMAEPQDVWRMPTTDEIVRSLVLHGENAGCAWDGESRQADCRIRPDKETPLWAPNCPPIYYWSADEYDERSAYYVSYNGWISVQPKSWGNPRHSYRCVREP